MFCLNWVNHLILFDLNDTIQDMYSITIHVCTMKILDIIYEHPKNLMSLVMCKLKSLKRITTKVV